MKMEHELKTWPAYFQLMLDEKKNFEIRENDRDFKVGDYLILKEFNSNKNEYTGREFKVLVKYILSENPFLDLGNKIIMAIEPIN